MTPQVSSQPLKDSCPDLERLLHEGGFPPPRFQASAIQCQTVMVRMRDGVRLATDVYLPPQLPAPVLVFRTPYGRSMEQSALVGSFHTFARRGYGVVSQDCRGTGESEPESWDYYMFEAEDGYDCIEWVTQQPWCGGFIGSFGGSYTGQTQWCMALHPAMSTIVPSVSGLGVASNTARLYMFLNAYAHAVGKGADKVSVPVNQMERFYEKETMAGGYFNDPLYPPLPEALTSRFPELKSMQPPEAQRWLWAQYCAMTGSQRAEFVRQVFGVSCVTSIEAEALPFIFGQRISHDALTLPHTSAPQLCRLINAPPLMRTGWYDWGLNDALATWQMLRREGRPEIASRARLIITAYAHNAPGYHVAADTNPELLIPADALSQVGLLIRWYEAVREGTTDAWPTVIYYLMGANQWYVASDWPVPETQPMAFYLASGGTLTTQPPQECSEPDRYTYDPTDPTPTVGGSIVSYLYRPGSVDVSDVQKRSDVLVYTSEILQRDLDVVGPLSMVLYVSSSARDTDFVARLSDVFPDGRAIQLQNGLLRARFRNVDEPALLEPHGVYRLEIPMAATANRFKAGHRLRVDISSADFPHFDRNSNLGGQEGHSIPAVQRIYCDQNHPSHLVASIVEK